MRFFTKRVSLRDIEIAQAAVEYALQSGRGGLTRAARRYGVSVPTASEALDRVEAAFGMSENPLFEPGKGRRTGRVTPIGKIFNREAAKIARKWANFYSEAVCWSPGDDGEWLLESD